MCQAISGHVTNFPLPTPYFPALLHKIPSTKHRPRYTVLLAILVIIDTVEAEQTILVKYPVVSTVDILHFIAVGIYSAFQNRKDRLVHYKRRIVWYL